MPRNGSGVYSLPSGNPVVDATTIEAAWANTTLTDIATEVTGSLPRNGSAPMTANMGMGGFKILNVADATLDTDAVNLKLLKTLYPVGSIYINASVATNPATLFGFGTWAAFGAGRVPVGIDAGDASFDVLEETGGSKDAIAVAHTHTFSATSGAQSADHTHSGTTASNGAHIHTIAMGQGRGFSSGCYAGGPQTSDTSDCGTRDTSSSGAHTHTITTGGASAGHTHTVSGTSDSTGAAGTNANLQPYIVVHMWKRTA